MLVKFIIELNHKNAGTLYIKQCFKSKIINLANKLISECKLDIFRVHRIGN